MSLMRDSKIDHRCGHLSVMLSMDLNMLFINILFILKLNPFHSQIVMIKLVSLSLLSQPETCCKSYLLFVSSTAIGEW